MITIKRIVTAWQPPGYRAIGLLTPQERARRVERKQKAKEKYDEGFGDTRFIKDPDAAIAFRLVHKLRTYEKLAGEELGWVGAAETEEEFRKRFLRANKDEALFRDSALSELAKTIIGKAYKIYTGQETTETAYPPDVSPARDRQVGGRIIDVAPESYDEENPELD